MLQHESTVDEVECARLKPAQVRMSVDLKATSTRHVVLLLRASNHRRGDVDSVHLDEVVGERQREPPDATPEVEGATRRQPRRPVANAGHEPVDVRPTGLEEIAYVPTGRGRRSGEHRAERIPFSQRIPLVTESRQRGGALAPRRAGQRGGRVHQRTDRACEAL